MFFWFLLLAAALPPSDGARVTPDEMFQLQLPYRYKVSIAEIGRDGLGRWELQVVDYYCTTLKRFKVVQEPVPLSPQSPLRRNAVRGHMVLEMDDVIWSYEDRYHHQTVMVIVADGEYLAVVRDREEHETLWPPKPDP